MFLHNFKYEFLQNIRQKEIIGWMMIFPIVLSTLFYVAFGDLYNKDIAFSEISVAVVNADEDQIFKSVVSELSEGDEALLDTVFTDSNEAEELLENGDVTAVIYVGDKLSMSVTGDSINASVVRSFLEQYTTQKTIITDVAMNNPEKLADVTQAFSNEINCIYTNKLTDRNIDPYASYFFNLIAMVALFGTTSGVFSATQNQGNLSAIGARKTIAPTHKLKATFSQLLASVCTQSVCTVLSTTYILFILKVDMGDNIPLIYLSGILGSLAGVALGFFIGSVGTASENTKFGLAFGVSMVCCFLSGLMIADMKPLISTYCPIINKLNPASLVSDLFYCLSLYNDYDRYTETAIILIVMSFVFTIAGFLFTRRKKYDSI
ncbi:MAG: ABC transporter permease [Ruminococcus sp.]|nr:ABC transporter permease [Ruminococcus sp.]